MKVEIIDTGCGIKSEFQQYLFKPFEELKQLQDFKKVQNKSIGLGLACSHSIIKALKGTIELKQSQKGFTKFEITIPVEVQAAVISQNTEQHTIVFNHGRRLKDQLMQYLMTKFPETDQSLNGQELSQIEFCKGSNLQHPRKPNMFKRRLSSISESKNKQSQIVQKKSSGQLNDMLKIQSQPELEVSESSLV